MGQEKPSPAKSRASASEIPPKLTFDGCPWIWRQSRPSSTWSCSKEYQEDFEPITPGPPHGDRWTASLVLAQKPFDNSCRVIAKSACWIRAPQAQSITSRARSQFGTPASLAVLVQLLNVFEIPILQRAFPECDRHSLKSCWSTALPTLSSARRL
jgi:hypothetical protein